MVFHALSADADMENLSIDSNSIRVHESANGNKKGRQKSQYSVTTKSSLFCLSIIYSFQRG